MKPFNYSLFTFLNASLFSLAPVLLVVYVPNTWWGWVIKGVAVIFALSAIASFMRQVPAQQHVYGGAAPGFVLVMPLLFFALWLDPGVFKVIAIALFLFLWISCFLLIYNNAKERLS